MSNKISISIKVGYSGFVLSIIFFLIKITEPLSFWNGHFPRFLQSTPAWWDGWLMVFLPLCLPIIILSVIAIIFLIILYFAIR